MEEENKTPFEEKVDNVAEKVQDFVEKVEDKVEEIADKVEDKIDEKKAEWDENKDEREEKKEKIAEALKTEDESADFDPADIDKNKIFAAIAYLGILVLIPIFAAKGSKFARFHSNQGLILFIIDIILYILVKIPVIKFFAYIADIAVFALAIYGIINAITGKAKRLPFIGKFDLLK